MNVWQYLERYNYCDIVIIAFDNLQFSQYKKNEIVRNLKQYQLVINHRAKNRFGCVSYNKKVLELTSRYFSSEYTLHEEWSENHKQTLLHEVAHIIVHLVQITAPAHGQLWKTVMRALGITPDRRGGTSFLTDECKAKQPNNKKHLYKCIKCNYEYRCNRRLKNIQDRCHSDCGGNFIHKQLR